MIVGSCLRSFIIAFYIYVSMSKNYLLPLSFLAVAAGFEPATFRRISGVSILDRPNPPLYLQPINRSARLPPAFRHLVIFSLFFSCLISLPSSLRLSYLHPSSLRSLSRDLIAASRSLIYLLSSFSECLAVSPQVPATVPRAHHLNSFISSYSPSAMFIAIWC